MAKLLVVKNLDVVVKDLCPDLLTGLVVPVMNQIHFEGVEKALEHGVIPIISFRLILHWLPETFSNP